jgi:hypothetical protein
MLSDKRIKELETEFSKLVEPEKVSQLIEIVLRVTKFDPDKVREYRRDAVAKYMTKLRAKAKENGVSVYSLVHKKPETDSHAN